MLINGPNSVVKNWINEDFGIKLVWSGLAWL